MCLGIIPGLFCGFKVSWYTMCVCKDRRCFVEAKEINILAFLLAIVVFAFMLGDATWLDKSEEPAEDAYFGLLESSDPEGDIDLARMQSDINALRRAILDNKLDEDHGAFDFNSGHNKKILEDLTALEDVLEEYDPEMAAPDAISWSVDLQVARSRLRTPKQRVDVTALIIALVAGVTAFAVTAVKKS
jgi:hypothetical protein